MSELSLINQNQIQISSFEVAELTDKSHKHVKRDIVKQFNELKEMPKYENVISKKTKRQVEVI